MASWTLEGGVVVIEYCEIEYFLKNNDCIDYTFENENQCLVKNENENECLMCTDNFHISNGGCVPSFIVDCEWYQTLTQCRQCKPGKYFNEDENKCLDVPLADQILNCQYYDADKKCVSCIFGFWVFEQKCIDLVANHHCLKFDTTPGHVGECLICAPNYQIDPYNNKQCISDEDIRFQYICANRCSSNTLRRYCQLNCTFDEFCDPQYVKFRNGCDQCLENYLLLPDETCVPNDTNDSHCLIPKI